MRYRFHYQSYCESTVKQNFFLKFNQKIIQNIYRIIYCSFKFFRIKKNYRKTKINTLDFDRFCKSAKINYKYNLNFSKNTPTPIFKKKVRNYSICFKSIKKFFSFISNFSISFIFFKNLLNSIFSLKKKSIISNEDKLNNSIQAVIHNNQKPNSPVFLYYFIFFLLLGLISFFYLGTENEQSIFLNWVKAQDLPIEKEDFSSDKVLAVVDKQENSLPRVILLKDKYSLETESYPKFYAGFNGILDFLIGNNDNINIKDGNSGEGGGPVDPSINYLAVGDKEKKKIINYESTNETISEDSIGDWVDENEQSIFEKKFSNPYLTVKKEDKIREAFEHQTYKVIAGDSLWSISKKFNITIDSIISLNQIKKLPNLAKGRKLLIPKLSGIYYKVEKDDSLFKITKKYGVTIEQVKEYNDLGGYLQVGKRLFLPGGKYSRFQKDYIFGNLFISPVDGVISSKYGFRLHPIKGKRLFHTGIDIAKNQGHKIRSVADGVVLQAGIKGGYGKYVLLKHSMGYKTAYAHLLIIWVKPGQKVKKGQFIGRVGNTGSSTGPHLHFEVKHNNKFINPLRFVKY